MTKICKNGKPWGSNNSYANPDYKEKLRKSKLKENNPSWIDGQSRKCIKNNSIWIEYFKSHLSCEICGSSSNKLVTHHKDNNYKNNVIENLMVVCRGCHNKIHKTKRLEL